LAVEDRRPGRRGEGAVGLVELPLLLGGHRGPLPFVAIDEEQVLRHAVPPIVESPGGPAYLYDEFNGSRIDIRGNHLDPSPSRGFAKVPGCRGLGLVMPKSAGCGWRRGRCGAARRLV